MGDKTMRVSIEPLAQARTAFNDLLASRRLNFLVDRGAVYVDRRVSAVPGSDGLVRLLARHVASVNVQGFAKPVEPEATPVGDRQLVDCALLALVGVVQEAGRRVADERREVDRW